MDVAISSNRMKPRHPRRHQLVANGLFEGLASFGALERRIEQLQSEQERGDAFEVFAEAYLATQKVQQAEEVWPADTAPVTVTKELRLPTTDKGVDGVLRRLDGGLAAYQVKWRSGRPSIPWRELGTFFGLADRAALRILFTNSDGFADVVGERRDFACIRGADLDRLTADEFAAMAEWHRSGVYKAAPKNPRPHQAKALADLELGLKDHDRATAVMACGSGKTLVALWLAERREAKRILVLVPSLALIRQTLHEWLKETCWETPRFLACCSDPSVTSGVDDALVVHAGDLDFPVTTDASDVRAFLRDDANDVRVVFSTYQSAHIVGEAIKRLPKFDLGIFDEAHKTAGREALKFAFALTDKNIPIAKRVFMTATPRHYDARQRDKDGEKTLVYSMDDPETYGPVVHTLTFAQAARQGIICDAKIIISVVTSEMLDEDRLRRGDVVIDGDAVRAKTVANQIALQKACEAHDLKKVFSFHRDVKSAADFTGETASSVRTHMPTFETLHVSGAMPTARREKHVQAFREAERAVLSNARCLTEGVDVPAVDLVAFLSPRKSKVDIVQAAGRAMRKSGDKTTGYVLLPLFLEMAKGETVEQALERTGFDEASDVIQAMIEQDDVLADIIRQMREERGRRGGFDDTRLRERIEVIGPQISLALIRNAVSARIVQEFGATWDERLGELALFRNLRGHCNVPNVHSENAGLGNWVSAQRQSRKVNQLSPDRVTRLDALGFTWDRFSAMWDEQLSELQAFMAQHGHCDVPTGYPENPKLAKWVTEQRGTRKENSLSSDRISRLDALGFEWDPFSAVWDEQLSELQAFMAQHGHCDVPTGYPENPKLARWVSGQRKAGKEDKLPPDRISRLDALGFEWDPFSAVWDEKFAELQAFKDQHGHSNVPDGYPENPKLAKWVQVQRQSRKEDKLPPDRISRLDALDLAWDPLAAAWDEKIAELQAFMAQHGHCNVPRSHAENPELGRWVGTQRRARKENRLSSERISRLDALGFEWDPLAAAWDEQFAALQAFMAQHGHCNVPRSHAENPELGRWVETQRGRSKANRLSSERISRLDALGFEWDPLSAAWDEKFAELQAFKDQHGHCNVLRGHSEDAELGMWVSRQRKALKANSLSSERISRLDALGFSWTPGRSE